MRGNSCVRGGEDACAPTNPESRDFEGALNFRARLTQVDRKSDSSAHVLLDNFCWESYVEFAQRHRNPAQQDLHTCGHCIDCTHGSFGKIRWKRRSVSTTMSAGDECFCKVATKVLNVPACRWQSSSYVVNLESDELLSASHLRFAVYIPRAIIALFETLLYPFVIRTAKSWNTRMVC